MTQLKTSPRGRFLRINPFRGLLIDERTWGEAHEYHRAQMRFHLLELHGVGIAQGLEVAAVQPPEMNVIVRPGVAIDPTGRLLVLTEPQVLPVPPQSSPGPVYVMLEYYEEEIERQNITESGTAQVSRVLEKCVAQITTDKSFNGVELARIVIDPSTKNIRNAANPVQPTRGEIDLNSRQTVGGTGGASSPAGRQTRQALNVGLVRYGPPSNLEWKRHTEGLRRLLREASNSTNLDANLLDGIPLEPSALDKCRMLYLTGRSGFSFSPAEEQALQKYLDKGGILWCEPCRNQASSAGRVEEFEQACLALAQRFNTRPIPLRPNHPLLSSRYLFAAPPPALDNSPGSQVYEAGRIFISTGDYACLWEGRGQEGAPPPPREILRSAGEFGSNALFLAAMPTR